MAKNSLWRASFGFIIVKDILKSDTSYVSHCVGLILSLLNPTYIYCKKINNIATREFVSVYHILGTDQESILWDAAHPYVWQTSDN